jgi:hypothetical protein
MSNQNMAETTLITIVMEETFKHELSYTEEDLKIVIKLIIR